uniref:Uncharacterized protein n=1 Tax=Mycena chlorophos TaxID=658473 RepID=A0ABQ0LFF9_MYCCL|nr:predicted protein [Mycena chlorophos]
MDREALFILHLLVHYGATISLSPTKNTDYILKSPYHNADLSAGRLSGARFLSTLAIWQSFRDNRLCDLAAYLLPDSNIQDVVIETQDLETILFRLPKSNFLAGLSVALDSKIALSRNSQRLLPRYFDRLGAALNFVYGSPSRIHQNLYITDVHSFEATNTGSFFYLSSLCQGDRQRNPLMRPPPAGYKRIPELERVTFYVPQLFTAEEGLEDQLSCMAVVLSKIGGRLGKAAYPVLSRTRNTFPVLLLHGRHALPQELVGKLPIVPFSYVYETYAEGVFVPLPLPTKPAPLASTPSSPTQLPQQAGSSSSDKLAAVATAASLGQPAFSQAPQTASSSVSAPVPPRAPVKPGAPIKPKTRAPVKPKTQQKEESSTAIELNFANLTTVPSELVEEFKNNPGPKTMLRGDSRNMPRWYALVRYRDKHGVDADGRPFTRWWQELERVKNDIYQSYVSYAQAQTLPTSTAAGPSVSAGPSRAPSPSMTTHLPEPIPAGPQPWVSSAMPPVGWFTFSTPSSTQPSWFDNQRGPGVPEPLKTRTPDPGLQAPPVRLDNGGSHRLDPGEPGFEYQEQQEAHACIEREPDYSDYFISSLYE